MKRPTDIVAAACVLALLWPVIALLAVLIRIDTPGNPFYGQIRVGRDEKLFTMWKLRSMYMGTPSLGTHEVATDRTTRVGRLVRRLKLDELPQAYNVLRGDMSLVGPRPCLPNQHAVIDERRARRVFAIRPGITGLAQIEGIDMSRPAELAQSDQNYMEQQSLALDVRICFRTIAGVLSRRQSA